MVNDNMDILCVESLLGLAGYNSSDEDEDDLPSPLLKSPSSLQKPVSKPVKPDSPNRGHGKDPTRGKQKNQVSYFLGFLAKIITTFQFHFKQKRVTHIIILT